MATAMKTKALAPWFGSNRLLSSEVGALLEGCRWVGVPFGGGMCELTAIDAPSIVVSDLHRHIVNLAMVVAEAGDQLRRELDAMPFHPDVLATAQGCCRAWEKVDWRAEVPSYDAAKWYFMAMWMGRSANAGTDKEFEGSTASGE